MQDIVPRQDFYVYLFRRNGIPFYVGKGCKERIEQHFACARKHETCKHLTCRVIRKEAREGGEVTAVKIAEGIPEQAAFRLEKLYISLAAVYGWPLVNQTFGGEGVSGYVRDEEWRVRRSKLTQQLVAEGRYEHLKTVNIGRTHTPEVEQKRRERVTEAWTDAELIEQQRQRQLERWSDPEEHERQRAIFADPIMRAKCGAANKGKESPKAKMYPGFLSPDGTIYTEVKNLTRFARDHGLQVSGMCLVAQGQQPSHKGWTLYPPPALLKTPIFKGAGFVSPDGTIYTGITHLSNFCQEHNLSQQCMSQVNTGKRKSYKGWTCYAPNQPEQGTLF